MRILGLDYGAHTVGVAVSDETGKIATRLEIIRRKTESHERKTLARIEALCETYGIEAIVLGLPLNMDGSESERAAKTRAFMERLIRRTGLPVYLQDERLTSVEAEEIMKETGIKPGDYKQYVDMIAAEVILQDYLNAREAAWKR
ncbi:MAG: Holliday junction resolvase RuvX [Lachnospiraceae bacterium]|nr:Holliday junction resolvase RuvX [Lachnospiraceae bacterium]